MKRYRLEFNPSELESVRSTLVFLNREWLAKFDGVLWLSVYIDLSEQELIIIKLKHNVVKCTSYDIISGMYMYETIV